MTNQLDLLLSQFDHLIQTPADVDKLNAAILDWAVRGQLLPQDPNDESASVLLERIAAEKARLVEAGEIKKPKKLPPIEDNDVPFAVPHGWIWTRLPDIYHSLGQKKPDQEFTYIDVGSIDQAVGAVKPDLQVISASDAPSRARKLVTIGTVIYSTVRPYLLNIAIIDRNFSPEPIVSTAFAVMHPFKGVHNKYLYLWLRSKAFIEFVESEMIGMAYPAISDSKLNMGLFPLPPLAEQKRIVAKVDDLFAQTRTLATELSAVESSRSHFCTSAIHALTSAQTPAQTQSAWQPMVDNLAALTANTQSVDQLKQAILQLAVSGRLVPQDPNDEPASVLLDRIAAEKARLVEAGEIKKPKKLNPIGEDEVPFEVPEGWVWERLNNISYVGTGATPLRSEEKYWTNGTIPWITSSATNELFVAKADEFVTELALTETNIRIYPKHTLIVAMYGQGKTRGQISELLTEASTNQACAAIVTSGTTAKYRRYIKLFFQKSYIELRSLAEGGAQPNLNLGKIQSTIIPLPPLAEQKRIVAKVDELHALCDQLAGEATTASTARERLLAAILAQSV